MERKSVSSAYNHATHLRERREMMIHWTDQLDALRKTPPGKGRAFEERRAKGSNIRGQLKKV